MATAGGGATVASLAADTGAGMEASTPRQAGQKAPGDDGVRRHISSIMSQLPTSSARKQQQELRLRAGAALQGARRRAGGEADGEEASNSDVFEAAQAGAGLEEAWQSWNGDVPPQWSTDMPFDLDPGTGTAAGQASGCWTQSQFPQEVPAGALGADGLWQAWQPVQEPSPPWPCEGQLADDAICGKPSVPDGAWLEATGAEAQGTVWQPWQQPGLEAQMPDAASRSEAPPNACGLDGRWAIGQPHSDEQLPWSCDQPGDGKFFGADGNTCQDNMWQGSCMANDMPLGETAASAMVNGQWQPHQAAEGMSMDGNWQPQQLALEQAEMNLGWESQQPPDSVDFAGEWQAEQTTLNESTNWLPQQPPQPWLGPPADAGEMMATGLGEQWPNCAPWSYDDIALGGCSSSGLLERGLPLPENDSGASADSDRSRGPPNGTLYHQPCGDDCTKDPIQKLLDSAEKDPIQKLLASEEMDPIQKLLAAEEDPGCQRQGPILASQPPCPTGDWDWKLPHGPMPSWPNIRSGAARPLTNGSHDGPGKLSASPPSRAQTRDDASGRRDVPSEDLATTESTRSKTSAESDSDGSDLLASCWPIPDSV